MPAGDPGERKQVHIVEKSYGNRLLEDNLPAPNHRFLLDRHVVGELQVDRRRVPECLECGLDRRGAQKVVFVHRVRRWDGCRCPARPEWMRVVRVGRPREIARPAKMGLVDVVLPARKKILRDRLPLRTCQACVGDDCGEPCRREGLLDAERRQRIDERSRVAYQEEPTPGIRIRRVERGVTGPGALQIRVVKHGRKLQRFCDLASIGIRERPTARNSRRCPIDHRSDVAHGARQRHRPGPAIFVRLDQGVRLVRKRPAAGPTPDPHHCVHAIRRFDATMRFAEDARTA